MTRKFFFSSSIDFSGYISSARVMYFVSLVTAMTEGRLDARVPHMTIKSLSQMCMLSHSQRGREAVLDTDELNIQPVGTG